MHKGGPLGNIRLTFILSILGAAMGVAAALIFVPWPAGPLLALLQVAVEAGAYWLFLRPLWQATALLEQGQSAEATILKVWDTGWTVNENPQVGLLLDVRPPGEEPFQAEVKSVVSRLAVGQLGPGAVVRLRYDLRGRRRVVLIPDAKIRPAVSGAAERLAELEGLYERGLVTAEEYAQKRCEILTGV